MKYSPEYMPGQDETYTDSKTVEQPDEQGAVQDDDRILRVLRTAHEQHRSHINTGVERRWINAYDAFQNRHFKDSKYNSPRWRGRSKHFRPKTRAAVRNAIATAAAALFSTDDAVTVKPQDSHNDRMRAAADLKQHLLNYRLDRTSGKAGLPWFLESMAAVEDATVAGICVSKQYWEYREKREEIPSVDEMGSQIIDETGAYVFQSKVTVERDRPMVRVYPPDQVIRDPAAHWANQAQDGAFLGLMNPMHVQDVEDLMNPDRPGKIRWRQIPRGRLISAGRTERDDEAATRRARDGNTTDRYDSDGQTVSDYSIVWATEWFFRLDGEEWHCWALGSSLLLSDPVPLSDAYPEQFGARPVVIGLGTLEAHKVDPMSNVESWAPMQSEINDLVNLMLDSMKQSVSPVTMVRRGAKINAREVQNRTADSMIYVNEQDDVAFHQVPGPNAASFQQMDRLNADFDDLAGKFSGGSVATNRSLNETVGGMNLLNGAANAVSEFDLRVWNETWVEPVLRQLVNLCSYYESDPKIFELVGKRAELAPKYGINVIDDDLIEAEVMLSVNCGVGASDPRQRLMKIGAALELLTKTFQQKAQDRLNIDEIAPEVWGAAGFPDGKDRFLLPPEDEDPRLTEAKAVIQQMQDEIDKLKAGNDAKIKVAKISAGSSLVQSLIGQVGKAQQQQVAGEQQMKRDQFGAEQKAKQFDQQAQHEQGMAQQQQDAGMQQLEKKAMTTVLMTLIQSMLEKDEPQDQPPPGGPPGPPPGGPPQMGRPPIPMGGPGVPMSG